jgi:hypothetical protein
MPSMIRPPNDPHHKHLPRNTQKRGLGALAKTVRIFFCLF